MLAEPGPPCRPCVPAVGGVSLMRTGNKMTVRGPWAGNARDGKQMAAGLRKRGAGPLSTSLACILCVCVCVCPSLPTPQTLELSWAAVQMIHIKF